MTPTDPEAQSIRRLIAMFALTGFATSLIIRVTDPLVAVIADDLTTSVGTVALLASSFALPFALIQPLLGPVGDALGKRRVILVCQVLLTLLVAAAAMAPDFTTLMIFRALAGAAAGGTMPLTLAVFGDEVPLARRQVAIGRFLVFTIIGGVAGGALAAVVEPLFGWRGVLWICAGFSAMASCVLLWSQLRAPPAPTQSFQPVMALQRYVGLFRLPAARVLYAAVAIEGGLVFGAFPHFAPLLAARGLGGTTEAGLSLAAFGCGGFIYAAIVAQVLRLMGQANMVRLGGFLAFLALLGMALAWSAAIFIGCALLLGTGFFMIHNTIQVRASEISPTARASGLAMHSFSFFIGQTAGPALMGVALALLGSTLAFIWVAAALLALGWWLSVTGPGTKKEHGG
ncbi:MFS transporter [Rhodovarius sp.]|uniref:MFS transporter n=1 Tax=Rhodovarius sp. TaxID=2972673 RepID=UPI0034A25B15